MVLIVKGPRI